MTRKKKTSPRKKPIDTDKIRKLLRRGPLSNREMRKVMGLTTKRYDPRLDRKLQQLRKEGKIRLSGSRWSLSTITPCPTCKGRGWVEPEAPMPDSLPPPAVEVVPSVDNPPS